MASFEPIIRIDENSFRAPAKLARKPLVKEKSLTKNFSGFKAPEKVLQPKVGRKPLGDLTNSSKPPAQEKSLKKNRTEKHSTVKKEKQPNSFGFGEGFLHNHNDCVKAHQQSESMSLDYFLETVALKRDCTSVTAPRLPQLSKLSELELDIPMEIVEMEEIGDFDFCAPPSPRSPRSPGSPFLSMDSEFSPLKLKESPVRG